MLAARFKSLAIGVTAATLTILGGALAYGGYTYGNGNTTGAGAIIGIEQGQNFACAIRQSDGAVGSGNVWCWGDNSSGQLGVGDNRSRATMVQIAGLTGVKQLALGDAFACALNTAGSVYCWGSNSNLQLGKGSDLANRITAISTPRKVDGIPKTFSITAGANFACAVSDSDGVPWCWGSKSRGQNGRVYVSSLEPVAVTGLNSQFRIDAGAAHACAWNEYSYLYCWGDNSAGQAGHTSVGISAIPAIANTDVTIARPAPVGNNFKVLSVAAAGNSTCSIKSDTNAIYCWGGQAGDESASALTWASRIVSMGLSAAWNVNPAQIYETLLSSSGNTASLQVPVQGTPVEVVGGNNHFCARLSDGRVTCWGANDQGQRGAQVAEVAFSSPTAAGNAGAGTQTALVGAGSGLVVGATVQMIDGSGSVAGTFQVSRRLTDTSLELSRVAGAATASGLLRVLVADDSASMVAGVEDAVALSAGGDSTCAIVTYGAVKCWGGNGSGQLGNGGTANAYAPVRLAMTGAAATLSGARVSGSLHYGNYVSADAWGAGVADTVSFQWQTSTDGSSWINISGANYYRYLVSRTDVGKYIRVLATSNNYNGSTSQTAAFSAAVPQEAPRLGVVSVTGSTGNGGTLTASVEPPYGAPVPDVTWKWQSSPDSETWSDIQSANASAYTINSDTYKLYVRVVATATNSVGVTTAYSGEISPSPIAPSLTATMSDVLVGSPASVTAVADGAPLPRLTYKWQVSAFNGTWTDLAGFTTATIDPPAEYVRYQVRVVVTATNSSGSTTFTTHPTVIDRPAGLQGVSAKGNPVVGGFVFGTALGLVGSPTPFARYQWQQSDDGVSGWTDIPGFNYAMAYPTAAQTSKFLRVRLTVNNSVRNVSSRTITAAGWQGREGEYDNYSLTMYSAPTAQISLPRQPKAIVQTAVGFEHACALRQDGSIWCWGANASGQIGNGGTTNSSTPTKVYESANFPAFQITAGSDHTCMLTVALVVSCWGKNDYGQLGDNSTTNRSSRVYPPGMYYFVEVAAGGSNTCAIDTGGRVYCWGFDRNANNFTNKVPTQVKGIETAVQIAVGADFACARLFDGSVKCWGDNGMHQVSSSSSINQGPTDIPLPTAAVQLSAGGQRACVLLADATVNCWGAGSNPAPVQVANVVGDSTTYVPLTGVKSVSAGGAAACAQLQSGNVYCWGSNTWSTFGDGSLAGSAAAVYVAKLRGVATLTEGSITACATYQDGAARCWGDNLRGQVGNGKSGGRQETPDLVLLGVAPTMDPPLLLGSARAGSQLSLQLVNVAGIPVPGVSVKWQRSADGATGWSDINGAVETSYILTTSDVNYRLRAVVTLANGIGTVTANSSATASVTSAPSVTSVTLNGTVQAGQSLTATATFGGSPAPVQKFTWQQSADGTTWRDIPGAIGGTLSLSVDLAGLKVRAVATAESTAAGPAATATSAATVPVYALSPAIGSVLLSGAQAVGATLTGDVRNVSATPTSQLAYQWQYSADAKVWVDIFNATALTYAVTRDSAGGYLRLRVTATNGVLPDGVRYSDATASISRELTAGMATAPAVGRWHACVIRHPGTVWCWGGNAPAGNDIWNAGQLGNGQMGGSSVPVQVSNLTAASQISAGENFTCALVTGGTVWCWGLNNNGQLGDGSSTNRSTPVQVGGVTGATSLSANGDTGCAVVANGAVKCWGAIGFGDAKNLNQSGVTGAVSVATSNRSFCALLDTGAVKCFGDNTYAILGNQLGAAATATAITLPGKATSIDASNSAACAVIADGSVTCWGQNYFGELGNTAAGSVLQAAAPMTGITDAKSVAMGAGFTCIGTKAGAVKCLGSNANGQVPGAVGYGPTPVQIPGLANVNAIAAGVFATCAVNAVGVDQCWGSGQLGLLGTGDWPATTLPSPIWLPTAPTVRSLSVSGDNSIGHYLAVSSVELGLPKPKATYQWQSSADGVTWSDVSGATNSSLWLSGKVPAGSSVRVMLILTNSEGSVTATSAAVTLTQAPALRSLKLIGVTRAGNRLVAAPADYDGFPKPALSYQWGTTSADGGSFRPIPGADQLAFTPSADLAGQTLAVKLTAVNSLGTASLVWSAGVVGSALTGVVAIDSEGARSCEVLSNGTVWCWGDGIGTRPAKVAGLSNAVDVAVGASHACALRVDSTVWCWGANNRGQLGNGTLVASTSPVQVVGLGEVEQLAAGGDSACVVLATGAVQCWGANGSKQLGDGTSTDRSIAVVLKDGNVAVLNASRVAVGPNTTCVLRADTSAVCVGAAAASRNSAFDVAVGANNACFTKSDQGAVCTGDDAAGVATNAPTADFILDTAVGATNACALSLGGSFKCWGSNAYGESAVSAITGIAAVSVGDGFACALDISGVATCWGRNDKGQLGDSTTTNRSVRTLVLGPSAPASTSVSISGTASSGNTLHASAASQAWPTPLFTYKWQYSADGSNWSDIPGAASADYAVSADYAGLSVRVLATAINELGSETATDKANVAGVAPTLTSVGFDSDPGVGQTLTAVLTGLAGSPAPTVDYEWQLSTNGSDWVKITSGPSSRYEPTVDQAGKYFRVIATATNSAGSVSRTSYGTSPTNYPPMFSAVSFDGKREWNTKLTAVVTGITGAPFPQLTYVWSASLDGQNWTVVSTNELVNYTTQAGGAYTRVTVTATNSVGTYSLTLTTSEKTTAPANFSGVSISGTPQVGQTLSSAVADLSGTPTPTLSYQWQRCDSNGLNCADIADATDPLYVLDFTDAGKRISVRASATNAAFTATRTSAATAVVTSAGGSDGIRQVSASNNFACAVRGGGSVWCWGSVAPYWSAYSQYYGELGDASVYFSHVDPKPVADVTSATQVATGDSFACALLSNGKVHCWGGLDFNRYPGQNASLWYSHADVPGISNAVAITAKYLHACALLADQTVKCWGWNNFGQLGDGTTNSTNITPVRAGTLSGVVSVAASGISTCAVKAGGSVWCWGTTGHGALGQNVLGDGSSMTPVQVQGISNATSIAATWDSFCAVTAAAHVACWGANQAGQLGLGDTADRATAVEIPGLAGVASVSGNANMSMCAVKTDATVVCWGRNSGYHVGLGDLSSPTSVDDGSGIASVAVGSFYMLTLNTSGVVRFTGTGDFGQAGQSTYSFTTAVVPIGQLPAITGAGISGNPLVGSVLTAKTVGAAGSPAPNVSYQWQKSVDGVNDWVDVGSGTSAKYTVGSAINYLRVRVTVSNDFGSAVAFSPATARVLAPPALTAATLTGTAQVGSVLMAAAAGVSGFPTPTASYQWQSAPAESNTWSDIDGSNTSQLPLTASAVGKKFRVVVTLANDYGSASATSYATVAVADLPHVQTVVMGTGRVGQAVYGKNLLTDSYPAVSETGYQWQRDDADGNWSNIAGATHLNYLIVPADAGHNIRVQLTATNSAGAVTDASDPFPVAAIVPNSILAVGAPKGSTTCVVKADGTVWCWSNVFSDDFRTPFRIGDDAHPVTDAVNLVVQSDSVCVLHADGTASCQGYSYDGNLGNGSTAEDLFPNLPVVGLSHAVALTKVGGGMCALIDDGRVVCWGYSDMGVLGNGDTFNSWTAAWNEATQSYPTGPIYPAADMSKPLAGITDAVSVQVGFRPCALTVNGDLYCWGTVWSDVYDATYDYWTQEPSVIDWVPRKEANIPDVLSYAAVDVGWISTGSECLITTAHRVRCRGAAPGDLVYGPWNDTAPNAVDNTYSTRVWTDMGYENVDQIALADGFFCIRQGADWSCAAVVVWGRLGAEFKPASSRLPMTLIPEMRGASTVVSHQGATCFLREAEFKCIGSPDYFLLTGEAGTPYPQPEGWTLRMTSAFADVIWPSAPVVTGVNLAGNAVVGNHITKSATATAKVEGPSVATTWQMSSDGKTWQDLANTNDSIPVLYSMAGKFLRVKAVATNSKGSDTGYSDVVAVPNVVAGRIVQIAAGVNHSCLVDSLGKLYCWGANDQGQLGTGDRTASTKPVEVTSLSGVLSVAVGLNHTCASLDTGSMYCWGANEHAQLGTGDTTASLTPVKLAWDSEVQSVFAAGNRTCSKLVSWVPPWGTDPGYWWSDLLCWGDNGLRQSAWLDWGWGTIPHRDDSYFGDIKNRVGYGDATLQMSLGSSHFCYFTPQWPAADGATMGCFGDNRSGQVNGSGDQRPGETYPWTGIYQNGVIYAAAGEQFSCWVTTDSTVRCIGDNQHGELGTANQTTPYDPTITTIAGLNSIRSVYAGGNSACAIDAAAKLHCWGANAAGQLGTSGPDSATPTLVASLSNVMQVSMADGITCAVVAGDRFDIPYCWGANYAGQLGIGSTAVTSGPQAVALAATAPSISSALVTGDPLPTSQLTATANGLGGSPSPVVDYQWQMSNDNIAWRDLVGQAGSTLQLDATLLGKFVRVSVTVSNSAGSANAISPSVVVRLPQDPLTIANSKTTFTAAESVALTTAGGSGAGAVTYTTTGAGCLITGTSLTVTSAPASCSVLAKKAAGGNYRAATSAAVVFTFSKAVQAALTITNSTLVVDAGQSITLTTTGGSGDGALGFSVTGANCKVTGTVLSATAWPSVCVVTASKAASALYAAANSASVTFKLGKLAQAALNITNASFSNPATATVAVTAAGGTGNGALSFAVTGAGCLIAGSNLTVSVAPATCSVVATRDGGAAYEDITSAAKVFTFTAVEQPALSVANATLSTTADKSFTVTTAGGAGTGAVKLAVTGTGCKLTAEVLTTTAVGNCSVTATKAASGIYLGAASTAVVFTFTAVQQPALKITSTLFTYTADLSVFVPLSGGAGNGAVSFAATGNGCRPGTMGISTTAIGTCVVTATKAASGIYAAATSAPVTFTFTAATQSTFLISNEKLSFTADQTVALTTIGGSGAGAVSYSVTGIGCKLTGASLTTTLTTTCTVKATKAAAGIYKAAVDDAVFTFTPLTQAVLSITNSKLSNLANVAVMLTTTGGSGTGPVSFAVTGAGCKIAVATLTTSTSGTCKVTATKASSGNYFAATSASVTFTFTAVPQTGFKIANTVLSAKVGAAITLTTSGGNGVGAVTFSVTGTGCKVVGNQLTATAAGKCSVTAKKAASGIYAAATSTVVVFSFTS